MKLRNKTILFLAVVLGLKVSGCLEAPGPETSIRTEIPQKYWVRVCLFEGIDKCALKAPSGFKITNSAGTTGTAVTKMSVELADGHLKLGSEIFDGGRVQIEPCKDGSFTINNKSYRGNLELSINPDKKSFMALNHVSMEEYLYGVVAAEMPSYWERQALRAQAIAARTYCLYIKSNFGINRSWDVKTTQANQVYKGLAAETARTRDAVDSTFGMILCSNNNSGRYEIFPAYYSSVCGGHTENSKNVFGDEFGPLRGIECPYCRETTRPSLFFWPSVEFKKSDVNERLMKRYPALKKLDKIKNIVVSKESDYGGFKRVTNVKIVGTNGKSDFLRAEDLRLTIDPSGAKIKSTVCRIVSLNDKYMFVAGRGFGHGLGLCQYGAREMARQNKDAQEILQYYYPGSKIKVIY